MTKKARLFAVALAGCVAFTSLPFSMAQAARTTEAEAAEETKITGLTTEYQTNPLGIEPEGVHFGWKMESTTVGAKQTAYQVRVTNDEGQPVWDSGKVESDRSTGIVCGEDLAQRTGYNWGVTVWDQTGKSYQTTAAFETGVTDLQEWKDAEFIGMNKSRLAPIFRCEKELTGTGVKKARLYITALGAYQAYINGNRVGELDADGNVVYHHMNPGYGNARVSLGYQTYDVTPFLSGKDSAAVSVSAGTGWYNGMGETNSQPAVKALLMIDYNDGSQQVIKTNTADWKGTLAGGITACGVYYGEDYNALFAKELGDYTQAGYDDSAWVNAQSGGAAAASPCITNSFTSQTASYIRLKVQEAGPANDARENFLQIMEMELLDGQNNVIRGKVPQINNSWSPNGQWKPEHLTDGDLGLKTDNGYTTNMMGNTGALSYTFTEPVEITFDLGSAVSFDTLKLYPRTAARPVSGNECPAYPKKYTLEISQDGNNWTPVDLNGADEGTGYTVENLRNTELFPEGSAEPQHIDTEFGRNVTAKKVKISVSQVGPAVYENNDWEKENRLQIMELELWDGTKNVAKDKVPKVTTDKPFEFGDTWRVQNLTDGDYGISSDKGYSTDILDTMKTTCDLTNPLTIEFDFEEAVEFSSLRIFPRSSKDSIVGGIYANYPKVFTVSVSENGTDWQELVTEEDKGMVRKMTDLQNMKMTTDSFPGVIRAQNGLPGRMSAEFDQNPVSAHVYSGNKATSDYEGGEVNILKEYEGKDMFAKGVELKKGDTMVVNMGQNLTAVPNIRFSGKLGTMATLRFAEMLNDGSHVGTGAFDADGPKGSIYQYSLRNARSQVKYVFAGEGVETYQPSMSFFGYQYVEITASDDIKIYGLVSKAISSVSDQTGRIVTNNPDVNKLFSNVLYGQLSNYYTAPTDCNQRDERLSWAGDTQAFVQTAVYNFDSYAFLRDMQKIFAENTKKNGYVASVVDQVDPNAFFGNWATGWSDVLIITPWTLYQQTGDISILEENWDVFQQYMTFMKDRERAPNHCMIPNNARNYGDWLSFQGTCLEVISDYYYGYMNQIMAQIAGILGKEAEKTAYEQKFAAIKQAFLDAHVTFSNNQLVIKSGEGDHRYQFMDSAGKGGTWENNSQTSLIWMLKLGFYKDDAMRDAAKELLVENIKNENPDPNSIRAQAKENTLAVGFLGSNVITPVLSDIGSAEVSYDLLLQDSLPSWLFEVRAGATTIWERWNSYTPGKGFGDREMNSFNHYAYGSVVEWMYRYMAGISSDVNNPGFKNIILQPTLDTGKKYNYEQRINGVNASYESMYGKITSSWKSQDGKLALYQTQIPANTTATLYLPAEGITFDPDSLVTNDQGPGVSGVTFKGMTEHNGYQAAEFALESGGYKFTVEDGILTAANGTGTIEDPVITPGTDLEKKTYSVTIEQSENGTVTADKTEVEEGGSVTFTITPTQGYVIKDVLVNGTSVGKVNTYTISNVLRDVSVKAVFEKETEKDPKDKYSVTIEETENGTVTADKTEVEEGGNVTFTITPAAGYIIKDVLVNGTSVGKVNTYTLENVSEDVIVKAVFEKEAEENPGATYKVTIEASENGTVTADKTEIEEGGSVTFTITPAQGYVIKDVLVNGASVGKVNSYKLDNVSGDVTVKAVFEKASPGTPGTPGTPETPGTPGTPGTPETPGTPGTRVPTPAEAEKDNPGLPKGNAEESRNSTFGKLSARVVKSAKTSNKLKRTKVKGADGYIVLGNKCGKKNKFKTVQIISKNGTVSFTHKKLKKGTYYKYIVQAYKMENGKLKIIATSKTIHAATAGGKVGNAKAVKVNKSKVTLARKGKKFTIKAKEVKKDKTIKRHRKISYESSNPKVASVSSKGVVKAKKKGTCYIYVYAQNGVFKKVKITVKK